MVSIICPECNTTHSSKEWNINTAKVVEGVDNPDLVQDIANPGHDHYWWVCPSCGSQVDNGDFTKLGLMVVLYDGLTIEQCENDLLHAGRRGFYNKIHKDDMYLIVANADDVPNITDSDIERIIRVHEEDLYDADGEYHLVLDNNMEVIIYA